MMQLMKVAAVRGIQPFYLGNKKLPKYWTADEVRRIIAVTHDDRYRLLFELLWRTGMRVSEALSLTPSHFDFYTKVVVVPTLKRRGRPTRIIPIADDLLYWVRSYIEEFCILPHQRLFSVTRQAVFDAVEKSCKLAELYDDRAHPHTFRHSFAVHCVLSGVPLVVLNEWLGHADIRNTLIYTKVTAQDTRAYYEQINW
jgi:site-specific recombinase XerD